MQKAVLPSSQFRQRPSATLNGMTTLSPFLSRVTPLPTSSTIPMFSWPIKVLLSVNWHGCTMESTLAEVEIGTEDETCLCSRSALVHVQV